MHGCTAADFVTVLVGTSQLPFPEAYWHKNDSVISTISGVNKVGIGTSNPSEQLTVGGNMQVDGLIRTGRIASPDSLIYFGDSTLVINTYHHRIYPDGQGTMKGLSIGNMSMNMAPLSTVIGYNVKILNENPMPEKSIIIGSYFKTNIPNSLVVGFNENSYNNKPTFLVGPSGGANSIPTGNVGISTSEPSDKLQIGEGVESISFGSAICEEAGWLFGYQSFNLKRARANQYNSSTWLSSANDNNSGGAVIGVNAQGTIILIPLKSGLATPISDLEVHKHQVVEIGGGEVNNTDNTLDGAYMKVHGKIIAKEIEVTLNGYTDWWPDYVFQKDYTLTPLQEVEKYINLHKHLPGVPSASDLQQKGLNVAEMDAALLKKIEELTLYIIEINKQMELLKEQNEILKMEMRKIKESE